MPRFSIQIFLLLATFTGLSLGQTNDEFICRKIFSYAYEHRLAEKPIGDIIVEVGRQLIGAPYEAHTLDQADTEQLVANLHSFDCITFVENVLALSRCIKSGQLSLGAYRDQLMATRYRGGVITGYTSRLHYFTDWIRDNDRRGILRDVSRQLGGKPYQKSFSFMTKHRSLYAKLADDSSFLALQATEDSLRQGQFFLLPKALIHEVSTKLQNGDIVGVTPRDSTLDVSHAGIVVKSGTGVVRYMHAPDVGGHVRISRESLSAFVGKRKSSTGIVVARVLD